MAHLRITRARESSTEDTVELSNVVCFRVTRHCNARCGFCLAPYDGTEQPSRELLARRIDWLFARGVTTIHFCGGEPTIHPGLIGLVEHVCALGGRTRLTTNAIRIDEAIVRALAKARTDVKVSLHGDRERHNEVVGRDAFDSTTSNLRRLVAANVSTSVQTTVVAGGASVVNWAAAFCVANRVRKLSILPFLPRGDGLARRGEYELSIAERSALRDLVATTRRSFAGRLDVRWLDFTARPIHAVEPDGRLVLEGASDAHDRVLAVIPDKESNDR